MNSTVPPADEQGFAGCVQPATSLEDALAAFVDHVSKGGSGRHRGEVARVVGGFVERAGGRGVETVADLDDRHLERHADFLSRRAWARESDPGSGVTGRTAHQYYALVRSFCSYLVDRNALEDNPAKRPVAIDALPDRSVGVRDSSDRRQFWSRETREGIVRWMDWRAEDAVDAGWMDPARAMRDRSLVAALAYSGARGAELFRDPQNEHRHGLRWRDVDLDGGTLRVFGRNQEWQPTPLLQPGVDRVRAHRRRQDPPTADWPVFPTNRLPSLYGALTATVPDADPTKDTVHELLREHGVAPPALTTAGARRLLRTVSAESGITEGGEPLKPHGARRGLGDELYDTSAELAQEVLRHESVETTHESYRDEDVGRLRDAAEDALLE